MCNDADLTMAGTSTDMAQNAVIDISNMGFVTILNTSHRKITDCSSFHLL